MNINIGMDHTLWLEDDNSPLGYCNLLNAIRRFKELIPSGNLIWHDEVVVMFHGPIIK